MIINCSTPDCKGKLNRPADLDFSIDVIECSHCGKLWDLRFGEPEPYVREQHIPDTRPSPVGEIPQKSIKYEDFKAELLADPEVRAEYEALEWSAIAQLRGQVLYYQKKVLTLLESKKKFKRPLKKYD